MPRAIVFDDGLGLLSPLTDLRAAFDVRTGALTTLERLTAALDLEVEAVFVPEGLAALYRERGGAAVNVPPTGEGLVLLVNGRCPYPLVQIDELSEGRVLVERDSGHLVAARVDATRAEALIRDSASAQELDLAVTETSERVLLSRPWHVKGSRDTCIDVDLELLADGESRDLPEGVIAIGDRPIVIHPDATVYPTVVLDAQTGPIHIAAGATIRPGVVIVGPAYVGEGSTIIDRALIKSHTAIGPVCKVGGEVGGCIFQGYANKVHDGHLGDSWIGEWVNLGAGTTNSNLLNTYGEVKARATPDSDPEPTGETFLGAIIGDHVKTAICTRIMTGAVIGTGVMWAASSSMSGCVAPFQWVTDLKASGFKIETLLETARRAAQRRGLQASPHTEDRLRSLCAASDAGMSDDA